VKLRSEIDRGNAGLAAGYSRQAATVAAQLAGILAILAVFNVASSPTAVVAGGAAQKLLFLAGFAVLIGMATWFLRLRGLSWADVGMRRPNWLRFALAIPLGLVATVVVTGAARGLLATVGVQGPNYAMFAAVRADLGQYLFWVLPVSWGTAAFGEELLMRGFVLDAFDRLLAGAGRSPAVVLAVILQAAVFTTVHLYQGVGGAVIAGVTGLMLGLVWLFSGRNLWAPIVLHGLIDTMSMTAIYLGAMSR
jgi:membrane protease YdiL (CAAX protease family)